MLRIIIVLFLVAHGLSRLVWTVKYMKLPKSQRLADGTTLLGGRWNVGEGGMRAFLALQALARIGFDVAAVALLVGLVGVEVGGPMLMGAGIVSILLSLTWWGGVAVWGLIIVPGFVVAVTLGVMWLEPRAAGWFFK